MRSLDRRLRRRECLCVFRITKHSGMVCLDRMVDLAYVVLPLSVR